MAAQVRRARSATAPIEAAEDAGALRSRSDHLPSPRELATKVTELERELKQALKERSELSRDVEALCMNNGGIFDGSMVLSERVAEYHKDLSRTRAQLAAVSEERDNLREDLRGHKDSKRTVDHSWRVERERAEKLERELRFYQSQSARAIADRDQASWEAEELKRKQLAMESRLKQAESTADAAVSEQHVLDRQLTEAQDRIQGLEVKARDCETIPSLWKRIAELTEDLKAREVAQEAVERSLSLSKHDQHDAREACNEATKRLAKAEQELQAVQTKATKEEDAAATKIETLEAEVQSLKEQKDSMEQRASNAEAESNAAQKRLETVQAESSSQLEELNTNHSAALQKAAADQKAKVEPLMNELETLRVDLQQTTADLEKTSHEKAQALMRIQQAEQTAEQAFEETGSLKDLVNDLKDRAGQATQEKVNALMQVATLKEQLRNSNRGGSATPQSKPTGWRLWGSPATEQSEGESFTNGDGEARAIPQDLREAIDQLRGVHERIAELETLAGSAAAIRRKLQEVQRSLEEQPTHLQRKKVAKNVEALKIEIEALEAQQQSREAGKDEGATPSSGQPNASPEKLGKSGSGRKRRGGDVEAAEELLTTLRSLWSALQLQSKS